MAKVYKYRYQERYKGHTIDLRADSPKALHDKVEAKKGQIDNGVLKQMTVGFWRKTWVRVYKEPFVSEKWLEEIERYTFKLRYLDTREVSSIRPSDLQTIINESQGKSKSTIRKLYNVISAMFHQAYLDGLTIKDLSVALKQPSGKPIGKRRAITPKERKALISVAEKHPKGVFLMVMLYSGLRPGEVRALQWKDVSLKDGIISVSAAGKDGRRVGLPKTSAGIRKIPIANELRPWLRPGNAFDFVCPNEHGKMMTEQNYKDMWISVKRMLHIELGGKIYRNQVMTPWAIADDFTLYCLRHTFGTDLEKKGVPINIAKVLMGHEDITTTAKIYTHFDNETLGIAAKLING